jgi:hypothetical protein
MGDEFEDSVDRIEQLMAASEPQLARAFLRMVAAIKSALILEEVADAIESGNWVDALDNALKAVPLMSEASADAFIEAARDTARFLNRALGEVRIVFDQTNFRAVNAIQANTLRLVRGLTSEQREMLRQLLLDGISRGINPREVARTLRESIGLTPYQERVVASYRRSLEQLDAAALQRALRDGRFDATVRRAINSRVPLTQPQINQMVGRYRARMLAQRAETIARTEGLRSAHEGSRAMYDQAIANGDLDPKMLTQEWNTAGDERVRHSHSAMQGQTQPYGAPFTSGDGNLLMYPGDASAPAHEVINCRCMVGMRLGAVK